MSYGKVLYLDLDGVLTDYVRGSFRHHGVSMPMREVGWDFHDRFGMTAEQWFATQGRDFWAGLDWTPEGRVLVAGLEALCGDRIVIVTSPVETPGCHDGKIAWVRAHLPRYARRTMIGACKELLAGPGKLLVDDNSGNAKKFREHGGHAVLVPRPWNERVGETCPEGGFDVARLLAEVEAAYRA